MYLTIILGGLGIATVSVSAIGTHAHNKMVRNYSEPFTIDALPPCLKNTERTNLESIDSDVRAIISEFTDTLGKISHINLSSFYDNYDPDRIDINSEPKNTSSNKSRFITLDKSRDMRAQLIPYLLEEAITVYEKDFKARGFERTKVTDYKDIIQYGKFLTDAYIKVLLERYFDIYDPKAPNLDTDLALYIESIVGREYMERAFFRSRLDEIVDLMSIYTSRKDVTMMIRELDHLGVVRGYQVPTVKLLSNITYRDIVIKLLNMTKSKLEIEPPETKKELEGILHKMVELTWNTYNHGLFIRYSSAQSTVQDIEKYTEEKRK